MRARRSNALIRVLQRGCCDHHGHVIREWIGLLLRRDWSMKIVALRDQFVARVVPRGDGWDRRFAAKFGVVYAALALAQVVNPDQRDPHNDRFSKMATDVDRRDPLADPDRRDPHNDRQAQTCK
jgi:hypothetical protein